MIETLGEVQGAVGEDGDDGSGGSSDEDDDDDLLGSRTAQQARRRKRRKKKKAAKKEAVESEAKAKLKKGIRQVKAVVKLKKGVIKKANPGPSGGNDSVKGKVGGSSKTHKAKKVVEENASEGGLVGSSTSVVTVSEENVTVTGDCTFLLSCAGKQHKRTSSTHPNSDGDDEPCRKSQSSQIHRDNYRAGALVGRCREHPAAVSPPSQRCSVLFHR